MKNWKNVLQSVQKNCAGVSSAIEQWLRTRLKLSRVGILTARIFTVIDIWDALLSDRPYSKAWPREKAKKYLKEESGKIFDPECVLLFLELVEQDKI